MNVSVHRKGRYSEGLGHHHACGFVAYARQRLQFFKAAGHVSPMHSDQQVSEFVHIASFGFSEPELADVFENLRFRQSSHGTRSWSSSKQGWSHFIDLFVGALRAKKHSDQQAERVAVIERNGWIWIVLI